MSDWKKPPPGVDRDVYRWIETYRRQHSYERMDALGRALTSLGRNLALAAFGARAFELGEQCAVEHERCGHADWEPGCGRPAP